MVKVLNVNLKVIIWVRHRQIRQEFSPVKFRSARTRTLACIHSPKPPVTALRMPTLVDDLRLRRPRDVQILRHHTTSQLILSRYPMTLFPDHLLKSHFHRLVWRRVTSSSRIYDAVVSRALKAKRRRPSDIFYDCIWHPLQSNVYCKYPTDDCLAPFIESILLSET